MLLGRATGRNYRTKPMRALGARLRESELSFDFVVENYIGRSGASLTPDPGLDSTQALGGLMDIVKIGDVMKSAEQLDQTFGSAANDIYRRSRANLFEPGAITPRTDFTGHPNPRSYPDRLLSPPDQSQAYVNRALIQTTNMNFGEDLHKIFDCRMMEG